MRIAGKKRMDRGVHTVSSLNGGRNGSKNKGRHKLVVPMKRKNLSVKKKEPPATSNSSKSTKTSRQKAAVSTPKKQKAKGTIENDEKGSDSDSSVDTPRETDLEELYEVTYVEDFVDAVDLVDDVARQNSQLLEVHCEQSQLLVMIESEMINFLGSNPDDFDPTNLSKEKKEILRTLEDLLIRQSKVGDQGVRISDEVETILEEKLRTLHIDFNNLTTERAKRDPDTPNVPKSSKNVKKPSINPPQRIVRGTPIKVNLADAASKNDGEPKIPFSSSLFASGTASPAPSFCSSSSFDTNKSGRYSQSRADGNPDEYRYRACKFKNPPNYVFNSRLPTSNTSTPKKPEGQSIQKKVVKEENETKNASSSHNKGQSLKRSLCSQGSNSKQGTDDTAEDSWEDSSSSDSDSSVSPEPTYCLCEKISHGKMVQCDNELCPIEWFHFKCVSLKKIPKGDWFCPKCRGENASVMKPKQQFLKELEQYNKEKEKED